MEDFGLGFCKFMLANKNRLKKKKEIERVFKEGRGFGGNFLFLKIVKNNLGISRFCFVVGKNLSKKATVRNRVRRRISELVRLKLKNIKNGIDAVFIALPGTEKKDFREIEKTIDKIFAKAKLLK